MEIKVSGWQCEDYIQNEDGMWPTSGTFTFSAEPEDGYELADGCAPLAVEVAVSDEAAMLAANAETYMIIPAQNQLLLIGMEQIYRVSMSSILMWTAEFIVKKMLLY